MQSAIEGFGGTWASRLWEVEVAQTIATLETGETHVLPVCTFRDVPALRSVWQWLADMRTSDLPSRSASGGHDSEARYGAPGIDLPRQILSVVTAETTVHKKRPGWNVFRDAYPKGEMRAEVTSRTDLLIARLRLLHGSIALFSHGLGRHLHLEP